VSSTLTNSTLLPRQDRVSAHAAVWTAIGALAARRRAVVGSARRRQPDCRRHGLLSRIGREERRVLIWAVCSPAAVGRSAVVNVSSDSGRGTAFQSTSASGRSAVRRRCRDRARVGPVDRAADFRQPQLHAVAVQQRQHLRELAAAERPLVFADHDRVEPAIGASRRGEQFGGSGSVGPGAAAGTADVEELGHDPAVAGGHVGGAVTLPSPRGPLGLVVDGGDPTVEREPQPPTAAGWRCPRGRTG
jgi:hypothetical protein